MRRTLSITLLGALVAFAGLATRAPAAAHADAGSDPRAEMSAALETQVNAYPAPAVLPSAIVPATPAVSAPSRTAAAPREHLDASAQAAGRIQQVLLGLSAALARHAQAAAQAIAGQVQSQAAKERAGRPKTGR